MKKKYLHLLLTLFSMYVPFWRIIQACYQVRMFHVKE